jgi:hypothetical protein
MHPPIGFASTVKVRSDPFWQALPIEELLLLGSIGNYYG